MNPIVAGSGIYLLEKIFEWILEEAEKRERRNKLFRHCIRMLKEENKRLLMKREIIEKNISLFSEKKRILKSNRERLERVGNNLAEADENRENAMVVIRNDLSRGEEGIEKRIEKYKSALKKIDKQIEKIELNILIIRYALKR